MVVEPPLRSRLALSLLLLIGCAGLGAGHRAAAAIRINEVMSANAAALANAYGSFDDWIELHNPGEQAIDLADWGLSDTPAQPYRWRFPPDTTATTLAPGGFLLVWASGRDQSPPTSEAGEFHTNFALSRGGEVLTLTRPEGSPADTVSIPALISDVSYGRQPDSTGDWAYFEASSPGAPNLATAYRGITPPPVFSHLPGFHPQPFLLSIEATNPGAEILYSLDGSLPSASRLAGESFSYRNAYPDGPLLSRTVTSHCYSAPVPIDNPANGPADLAYINLAALRYATPPLQPLAPPFKGTVVRAVAQLPGHLPSTATTATFWIHPDGQSRYPLPVVSLIADEPDLFDDERGIFVPGNLYNEWRRAHPETGPEFWMAPANYLQSGDESERPAHLEWFEPDGRLALRQAVGLRIHGNSTRALPRKPLRLYARERYGAGSMNHALFPGLLARGDSGAAVEQFQTVLLRSEYDQGGAYFYQDALVQEWMAPLGFDIQAYRPVVHFINGEYWGVMSLQERYDEHYLASHYGIDPEDAVILDSPWGTQVGTGLPEDAQPYLDLLDYVANHDLSDDEHFAHVAARVDLTNLIHYTVANIYLNSLDWGANGNNTRLWRKRTSGPVDHAPYGHDGRWRWMMFDTGASLAYPNTNTLERVLGSSPPLILFTRLLDHPEFRHQVINSFADQLNSTFTEARFVAVNQRIYAELAPALAEHNLRWDGNVEQGFGNYARVRPAHLRQHLINTFGLTGTASLEVTLPDPLLGRLRVNSLAFNGGSDATPSGPAPWAGTYFSGVPIQLEALPEPGHRLRGWWVGSPESIPTPAEVDQFFSTAPLLLLSLEGDTAVVPVFELIPLAEQPYGIHAWRFEQPGDVLSPSYSIGQGTLNFTPGPAATLERNEPAQDFASPHLRLNLPLGASLTVAAPTTGYSAVTVGYRTRRSGQGAGLQTFAYSLDGLVWTDLATAPVLDAPPQLRFYDLSPIDGVANNPDFAFRISFSLGDGGTAGNHRFDDLVVSGIALPGTDLPPILLAAAVPDLLTTATGIPPASVDLAPWFYDAESAPLVLTATSSDSSVLSVATDGSALLLSGQRPGEAWVTVHADDGSNPPVAVQTRVLVHPVPCLLLEQPFAFDTWPATAAAGSFPAHMMFLQSQLSDPGADAPLLHPYAIPAADAAAPIDAVLPYAASSRTRINGLGSQGVAFINTGRGRDLGGALLALDTSGVTAIDVSFVVATLQPNSRTSAFRLQARTAPDQPWDDLLDADGNPIVYTSDSTAGHTAALGPFRLPPSLKAKPGLQLLWRYHHVAGDSGPRAQLRLDDIAVSAEPMVPASVRITGLPPFLSPGALPVLVVEVIDEDGYVVTHFSGEVTFDLAGEGQLGGTTTVTAEGGLAVFTDLSVEGAGGIQLNATIAGLGTVAGPIGRLLRWTDVVLPRYILGSTEPTTTPLARLPFAFRARIEGLAAGATYRFAQGMVHAGGGEAPGSPGAGDGVVAGLAGGAPVRLSLPPGFSPEDLGLHHAELTADALGCWEGWLVTEPTTDARFTAGNRLHPQVILNDGAGGTEAAWFLRSTAEVEVVELGGAAAQASGVYGELTAATTGWIVLAGDAEGSARPLAAAALEPMHSAADDSYASFYRDVVAGVPGRWGALIPNDLAHGLLYLELLDADGTRVSTQAFADGAAGTVLACSGSNAIWIPAEEGFRFLPTGDGRWDDPNHWSQTAPPEGAGVVVTVEAPFAEERELVLAEGVSVQIGGIVFAGAHGVTRLSGEGTLTLDGADGSAVLRLETSGNAGAELDLQGEVHLATDLIVEVGPAAEGGAEGANGGLSDAAVLVMKGSWGGVGGITKRGPGTAILAGSNNPFGGALVVEQGALWLGEAAAPVASSALQVLPGGQLGLAVPGSDRHLDFPAILQLAGGGREPGVPGGCAADRAAGALRFDPGHGSHQLTLSSPVELAGAPGDTAAVHVVGSANRLTLSGLLTGEATLTKSGSGTLELAGDSAGELSVVAQAGGVHVSGLLPATALSLGADAALSGSGSLGAVSGDGTLSLFPGDALTVQSVAGTHFDFVLGDGDTAVPLVHLRDNADSALPLQPAQQVRVFLASPNPAGTFAGGFFSASGSDLTEWASGASWSFFVPDPEGPVLAYGTAYRSALVRDPEFASVPHVLDDPAGPVSGSLLQITLRRAHLADFLLWRAARFNPQQLTDAAVSGLLAQPLADGQPNLLKFALGLDPFERITTDHLSAGLDEAGLLALRFRRNPNLEDLAYRVEAFDLPGSPPSLLFDSRVDPRPNNEGSFLRIDDQPPAGVASPHRFLRLSIHITGPD